MRITEENATESRRSLDEQIRELTVSVIGSKPWHLTTNTSSPAPFNIFEVTTINATAPTLSCTETWVKINDDALRKELDKLLEKVWPGEISFGQNPIDAKRLYHFMTGLIEHCKCEDGDSSVSSALQLLVYWATLFKSNIDVKVQEMRSTKLVEYEYLWALFEPGKIMVTENFLGMKDLTVCVKLIGFEELINDDKRKLRLTMQTIDTTSGNYGYHRQTTFITSFVGKEHVCDLVMYPLSYHKDSQELEKRLVSRGREFIQLTRDDGFHFRQYEGKVILDGSSGTSDWEDERIVVDCCALNKERPFSTLPRITRGLGNSWLDPDKLIDEELLICSGTVPALILSKAKIGTVAIDCLQPVEWRDISVAKNVGLADNTKANMGTIMQIAKDGFGQQQSTVIVFYGGSNLGKKWTVEVIAEEWKRPIFTVSFSLLPEILTRANADFNFKILPLSHPQGSPSDWIYGLCNRWGAIMHVQEPIKAMLDRGRHAPPQPYIGLDCMVDDLRALKGGVVCFMTTSYADWTHPDLWSYATLGVEFEQPRAMEVRVFWSNALAKAGVKLSDEEIESLAKGMNKISEVCRKAAAKWQK
ncbi:hypothetical protein BFJ63_vAg16036 [Fusarium oxysporum f. sp. narcissi]|uniref:DUF7025 domain-containing protein n=1 Tax=Fusarium oxysporum f. sp. narcissi TaxID=451672 RepID=A0A4Q2V8G4_FUSOX|nr:hypothetical protein BFJ63_vAg16036 [Fusarium oxysporum f. sp. narcissi]